MTKEEQINTVPLEFNLLFQNLPEACVIKDSSLKWLMYNEEAKDLFGILSSITINDDFDIFHDELAKHVQAHDQQVLNGQTIGPQIISWPTDSGTQKLIEIKRSLIENNDTKLLLCQIQPFEAAENHPEIYQVLELIKQTLAYGTQESFLERIVKGIAETLGVDFVMICTFEQEEQKLDSKAFWNKDHFDSYDYAIKNTPCEKLIKTSQSLCIIANAAKLYPEDTDLKDMGVEGYLGVPLFSSTQQLIGHLVIMDTKPLSRVAIAQTVMQIYSSRIAAELERNQKEEELRLSEQQNQFILETKVKELDEKNQQLQQYIDSNLQLENFAYVASHDLKEPLRTIGNFSQLLKRRYSDHLDADGRDFLNFIISGVSDMSQLIEGLLEFAKVNTESANKEIVDPHLIIHSVVESLQQVIKESRTNVSIEPIPRQVFANPLQLKQVFLNLINNAIKFRKQDVDPQILIRSQETETHWQFSVQDNGEGIREDFHETIFMLFRKLHSRHDHQGSGIGLAICKEIVTQHGGIIWLESKEGKGAAFHFTIAK